MGYSHYWDRPEVIPTTQFNAIRADFERIVIALDDMGVRLADGMGVQVPIITSDKIVFNGYANCGHAENKTISIPWPAPAAKGVGNNQSAESGEWFAGSLLKARACDGDCSYETFGFERIMQLSDSSRDDPDAAKTGLFFDCCKTAFRPYDIAVTAFLVIAKQHLGDCISVRSDGENENWIDAFRLCSSVLGYGMEYEMTGDGLWNMSRPSLKPFETAKRDVHAERREAKKQESARLRTDAKYNHLTRSGENAKLHGCTLAATNMRQELKLAFKGVKFSVKSDRFSGGDSIDVRWIDGPTTSQVDAIIGKYKAGTFDGMTDCYNYESSAWTEVFGDANYVHSQRKHSVEALRAAVLEVCFEYGWDLIEVKRSEYDGSGYLDRTASNDQERTIFDYIEKRHQYEKAA